MNLITTRGARLYVGLIACNLLWVMGSAAGIDPESVVGAWLFDDGNGEIAIDASGRDNNGTLIVGPQWVEGKYGTALAFDGTGSYVEVSNHESLVLTDTVSLSFWVQRTRLSLDIIVEKGGDWTTGECNYGVGLHSVNDNMFYFFFTGGWRGTPGVDDMDWHHYAIVATNGEADPTFYIDGDERPVDSGDGREEMVLSPSERPLHFGAQVDPQWKYYSTVIIDEIAIFNAALSQDDVGTLMGGLKSSVLAVAPSGKLATTWAKMKDDR